MTQNPLSRDQVAQFERDGFLVVRGFYDLVSEIAPIQRAIYDVIGLIMRRHDFPISRSPFHQDTFDEGFQELIAANRRYGSEVYDAVKMIPAFVRLAASERNEAILRQLRGQVLPGFITRGYGIRIDVPHEDMFRSLWHQEYLFQLRSRDGITLWSPLVQMIPELGPVHFAVGSHREGIHPVYDGDPSKPGAYSWTIKNEAEIIARYPHVAPLSNPGDLIVLDFQVLHCSGFNRSHRSRWSMQMRLFNFLEESGVATGWKGAVAEGIRVADVFPQFFVPRAGGDPHMKNCDICHTAIDQPIYISRGHASMTTMLKLYDEPTTVWFCNGCGHLQTTEIIASDEYYAHQYTLLAATEDEDLLYGVVNGHPIFQVEHRVDTLRRKVSIPQNARVLDFGCAKGTVLQRLQTVRSDITPFLFDVTDRYVHFWRKFAAPHQWSTGCLPRIWREQMDVVCSFYVLEHVADPVATVRDMASLLNRNGVLYLIVPNVLFNSADFVVADHLQHYSPRSFVELMRRADLELVEVDDKSHESAYIAIAIKRESTEPAPSISMTHAPAAELGPRYEEMANYWSTLSNRVRDFEQTIVAGRPACIYGAGFYGNFVASCLLGSQHVRCFVDQNPHLAGRTMLGKPIVAPHELPADIDVMYVGLNPKVARSAIAAITAWRGREFVALYL